MTDCWRMIRSHPSQPMRSMLSNGYSISAGSMKLMGLSESPIQTPSSIAE